MYTLKLKVDGKPIPLKKEWGDIETAYRAARLYNRFKGIVAAVVEAPPPNPDKRNK